MKNRQIFRLGIQLVCFLLTVIGLFVNFQITTMIILAVTFFGGAFYCGWICPFGTIQDLFSKMGKSLGIKPLKMPKIIQRYLMWIRYILAALFMLTSLEILFTLMSFDPRANLGTFLLGNMIGISAIVVIISFALISLFFERPFCNYLCIEGAKYGAIGSLRIFTVKRNSNSCVNCQKCDKACPMNISVSTSTQVRSLQCINCMECVDNCPVKNTLTYGPIRLSARLKKYYIIGVFLLVFGIGTVFGFSYLNKAQSESSAQSITSLVEESLAAAETEESIVTENETVIERDSTDATTDNSIDPTIGSEAITSANTSSEPNSTSNSTSNSTTTTTTSTTTAATSESNSGNSVATTDAATTVAESENADTTTDTTTETTSDITTETVVTEVTLTPAEIESLGEFSGIADGVYSGIGYGFRGQMTVEVTFKDEAIVKVEVVEYRDDRKWFNRANNTIPDEIVDAQSADVDTVSGATFSSRGIIQGAQAAIDAAKAAN